MNPYGDPGADPAHEWAQTKGTDMQDQQQQQGDGQWERPEHPTMETVQGPGHRRRIIAAVAGAVAVAGIVGVAVWAGTGGTDDTADAGTRGGVPVSWHPTAAETPPPAARMGVSPGTSGTVTPADPVTPADGADPWTAAGDRSTQRWDDASRDAIDAQNERVFLEVVRSEGVRFPSDADAVEYGRGVCADVDQTGSVSVTAMALFLDPAPLTSDEAAYMVGASIAAFCPEHEASMWEFVDSTR